MGYGFCILRYSGQNPDPYLNSLFLGMYERNYCIQRAIEDMHTRGNAISTMEQVCGQILTRACTDETAAPMLMRARITSVVNDPVKLVEYTFGNCSQGMLEPTAQVHIWKAAS